jgi:hypothetical protein
MAKDWELKSLERRIDSLEEENRKRRERHGRLFEVIWYAALAAFWAAVITLVVTGSLHHH